MKSYGMKLLNICSVRRNGSKGVDIKIENDIKIEDEEGFYIIQS